MVIATLHLMNETADIKRYVEDYADMGGVSRTLSTISTSHPVRISESVPSEVSAGAVNYAEANAVVYTIPLVDVLPGDEVHARSRVYEVIGVVEPSVTDHHQRLVCKVRTDG